MKFPAFANVHSHAFQYAIAGLTECASSKSDSFWTWRKKMYQAVHDFNPDSLKACATQLYQRMLANGYTAVGEFHYLHHQPNGKAYKNITAMSEAIIEAAESTGIKLTLLPVLYTYSNFDQQEISEQQKPFYNDTASYINLMDHLVSLCSKLDNIRLGIAFHSLRACSIKQITEVLKWRQKTLPNCPVHIHISEQNQEVNDCQQVTSLKPIEYLYENVSVDHNWTLIHATHSNQDELKLIANSQAIVGLCPSTEANLGDGLFPLKEFINLGGRFAIGSDSQVSLKPLSEIQLLEYGQRLITQSRSVCVTEEVPHPGFLLWQECSSNGFNSLQAKQDFIEINISKEFNDYSQQYLADLLVFTDKIQ
ncbi:MAG: formimidoylglutamate deiminase [Lentisphaerales bacterium]|nr:formimidoylglutamate deiminase [Lentisphaerales bacterium]